MALYCAISNEVPEVPVVSPSSGAVFEKRIIEKYIIENGVDPISGKELRVEDLIEIKTPPIVKPKPPSATSIPATLKSMQDEWDALMLHTFTQRQQLQTARQELSHALYQHDAACRVIARLTKEVTAAREALATLKPQAGIVAPQPAHAAEAAAGSGGAVPIGMSAEVVSRLQERATALTQERKRRGRTVPEGLQPPEQIRAFLTLASHPGLHSASVPGILSLDINPSDHSRLLTGGNDRNATVFNKDTEQVVAILKGHTKKVTRVIYHPDEDTVVTASPDHTIRVWNVPTSQTVVLLRPHEGPVTGLSLHPTGDYVLSTSTDQSWAFSDIRTGALLTKEALQGLLERDSFFAPEVDIFKAVCNWFNANQQWVKSDSGMAQSEKILKCVRLTLMSLEELLTVVRPFSLVTPDMLLDAIQEKTQTNSTGLPHRGLLLPEENVATAKRGARVLTGDMRGALLDGDVDNYDMEHGYTRHTISDAADNPGIVVRLATTTIINHLRLLLWDRDNRSYAYYIEVSIDQKDWVRVIDHSNYFCRSWQNLYFEPRVVQYIKIVGTSNTVNKVFHAVSLEAMHTARVPPLCDGLIKPLHNVATVDLSAVVAEGISRSRNALLNGDTEHYDWEQGYTCHQLGSGAIVVQLAQPYLLSSIRMLLWDCDYRHYSYYVEVSINYWHWDMVADRTRDHCRSWQVIYFSPRPVSIIRVVGTNNSVNEVFHLVHLECPAQVEREDPAAKKQRAEGGDRLAPQGSSSNTSNSSQERRSPSPAREGAAPEPPRRALPVAETATEAEERYEAID